MLAALLAPTLPHLQKLAERADAAWAYETTPQAEASRVDINPTSLQQILVNLVDNAGKHAVTDRALSITLRIKLEAQDVCLQVIDNGPDLTPAQAKRAFTAFQQASNTTQAKPGIGLGLSLSRTLARQAGGDLVYLNHANKPGTTFELRLPLAG